jgi:hypothetical protein
MPRAAEIGPYDYFGSQCNVKRSAASAGVKCSRIEASILMFLMVDSGMSSFSNLYKFR